MNTKRKTAAAMTIGCRLNQADTALIYDRLIQAGYEIVPANAPHIDAAIINTCTVTSVASQKSHQAARKWRRQHPESCIVVTGCSSEIEREAWSGEEGVDIILSNEEKRSIVSRLEEFFAGTHTEDSGFAPLGEDDFLEKANARFPFRSRAFLKIQEGCNSFCSYCIVPYARGRERSRDKNEIVSEFKKFLKDGFKEIILTGVNICAYDNAGFNLAGIVSELASIPGHFRIRLSSTEPHPSNLELLEIMEKHPGKICRFLHLPLQHGSDEILKSMNRKYTCAEYALFVQEARRRIPGIHMGADIIVGFPGETDELFQKMRDFIKEMNFANLHIFTYSKREGTPATDFPGQVPKDTAKQRYNILTEDSKLTAQEFANSHIGKSIEVLLEKEIRPNVFEGWSDNYLRIKAHGSNLKQNELHQVQIEKANSKKMLEGTVLA